MKQFTRLALGTLMVAGLFAATFMPAPAATDTVSFDGPAPTPWCRPSDPNCTGK